MDKVLEEFFGLGIVPVIAIDHAEDAELLANALRNGGLPCAEITFRTDAAKEAIRRMLARFPEMLVGAGTVLTTEQAKSAVDAGAKFIVSPGFNPKVVEWCLSRHVPVIPGCACPSDIERALEMGLSAVKFFPAEASGGLMAIKAMSAPYGSLMFMPTGGISLQNMNRYLAFEKIVACGGSWMASRALIGQKDWDGIAAKTREAVAAMLGFSLKRIGICVRNGEDTNKAAAAFAAFCGTEVKEGKDSLVASEFVEIRKEPSEGAHGEIVVGTNHVGRAVYHLQKRGFCFQAGGNGHEASQAAAPVCAVGKIAGHTVRLVQTKNEY